MRLIARHRSIVLVAMVIGFAGTVFPVLDSLRYGKTFAATPANERPALAVQTNREGNITVKAVPRNLSGDAASWDFEITLESHTQALNQDLTRSAILIDAAGKSHTAIGWDGDPPGGHHRRGLLRFRPLPGKQATVELRVLGIGGVDTRAFRWQLE